MNEANTKGGKLDRLGIRPTPGMPHWSDEANAQRHRNAVAAHQPERKPAKPRVTVCPAGKDQRYTVKELPANYVSQLDPACCRSWADSYVNG